MKRKAKADGMSLREFDSFLSTELHAHVPKELGLIISSYHIPVITSIQKKKIIPLEVNIHHIIPYKSHAYVFCDEICYVLDEYGLKTREFKLCTDYNSVVQIHKEEIYISDGKNICAYDVNGIFKRIVVPNCLYSPFTIMNNCLYVCNDGEKITRCDTYGNCKATITVEEHPIFSIIHAYSNELIALTRFGGSVPYDDCMISNFSNYDFNRIISSSHHLFALDINCNKCFIYDIYKTTQCCVDIPNGLMTAVVNGEIWTIEENSIWIYECLI